MDNAKETKEAEIEEFINSVINFQFESNKPEEKYAKKLDLAGLN